MKFRPNPLLVDKAGMSASILCALHCAIVPMLATLLPLWGLSFLAECWIELFMIALSFALASFALLSAYAKHRKTLPIVILVFGFLLIGLGHLVGELEHVIVPIGGMIIAYAHFLNIRMTRGCMHQASRSNIKEI